ncbi:MAG TPA: hypothetical protein VIY52_22440 [Streptosporangiaceae bacterium]
MGSIGLTTSFAYDSLGWLVTEIDPPVTDRVTGAVHTEVVSYAYDPDSDVLTSTLEGYTGNPSKPIPAENLVLQSRAYDPAGRLGTALLFPPCPALSWKGDGA